ncbi:hypothetical protein EDB87DRAFT_1551082, partial [Lactarius vividus]
WGRLRLPNGQVARSLWCESKRASGKVRVTWNVKVYDAPHPYALVSVYSPPVQELLVESSNTLWACRYRGSEDLRVVDLSNITACVLMQP